MPMYWKKMNGKDDFKYSLKMMTANFFYKKIYFPYFPHNQSFEYQGNS
jgi:hypothetical protein